MAVKHVATPYRQGPSGLNYQRDNCVSILKSFLMEWGKEECLAFCTYNSTKEKERKSYLYQNQTSPFFPLLGQLNRSSCCTDMHSVKMTFRNCPSEGSSNWHLYDDRLAIVNLNQKKKPPPPEFSAEVPILENNIKKKMYSPM